MGIAMTACITVPTLVGTTSVGGTAGSTEVAGTTESAQLAAQPILAVCL